MGGLHLSLPLKVVEAQLNTYNFRVIGKSRSSSMVGYSPDNLVQAGPARSSAIVVTRMVLEGEARLLSRYVGSLSG